MYNPTNRSIQSQKASEPFKVTFTPVVTKLLSEAAGPLHGSISYQAILNCGTERSRIRSNLRTAWGSKKSFMDEIYNEKITTLRSNGSSCFSEYDMEQV
jgi:hypothetical protein